MNNPTALLFDYGNTLIAFGPAQQEAQLAAMRAVFDDEGLRYDTQEMEILRHEQILRPFQRGGIENDYRAVCREVVERYTDDPGDRITRRIMRARYDAFLGSVAVDPAVLELLSRLKRSHRLGLLSNYPCVDAILDSLHKLGLLPFFETVVVSGDVGFAKPHPKPYEVLLARMKLRPEESVYIGDNWLADVQGAKRLGMRAVWLREHIPYERFEPSAGDHPADAELTRLSDLPALLEHWSGGIPATL